MSIKTYSSNTSKKQLFLLSIPVFFSNMAIPLVGIVDTGLMGNLGEAKFLAATSIGTTFMTLIIWSFGFLRMGTVGIVAQLYGRSDFREIIRTLFRNLIFAFIISIFLILSKPIFIFIANKYFLISLETQNLVDTYISTRIFSIPFEFVIFILIGFYLGIQKTNISGLLIIFWSTVNIILSSFFVLTLDLEIFGVVLGTLISSIITAFLFSFITYKYIIKNFQIIPRFERIFDPLKFVRLFYINLDIFFRTLFLTFAFLWVTYLGSKIGEDYLAVNTILMQFIILAAFFLDAYAFSAEGVVGYNVGRKNIKSFNLVVENSIKLSFFTSLFISLIFIIFLKPMINIFTDIEMLRFLAYKHAFWIIILPPVASFCYQLDGIFIGASQTKDIKHAMIISVVFFIIISIFLVKQFGNHGLWLAFILFMFIRSVTLTLFFNNIFKKFK